MDEQAIRYFLHPDFAAGCWLKETERKRLRGRLINQLQLQVLLNQIFKVAGRLSSTLYIGARMLSQGQAEMWPTAGAWPFVLPLNDLFFQGGGWGFLKGSPPQGKRNSQLVDTGKQVLLFSVQNIIRPSLHPFSLLDIFPLICIHVMGWGRYGQKTFKPVGTS